LKFNGARTEENHNLKEWLFTGVISFLGLLLFFLDMAMLAFFIKALISIIKHYSKDYEINLIFVKCVIILICLTYTIDMIWSDFCMWGSVLNFLAFFHSLRTLNSE